MKKNIVRILLVGSLVLILVFLLKGYAFYTDRLVTRVHVVNDSEVPIESVEITYFKKTLKLKTLAPGRSVTKRINTSDAHFDIRVWFNDGTVLEKELLGYVTTYDGSDNIFLITADKELKFSQAYPAN